MSLRVRLVVEDVGSFGDTKNAEEIVLATIDDARHALVEKMCEPAQVKQTIVGCALHEGVRGVVESGIKKALAEIAATSAHKLSSWEPRSATDEKKNGEQSTTSSTEQGSPR